MLKNDIFNLREAVIKITQLLADKSIEVTQRGMKAFVESDTKTGKPKRVNLPYLPDNASDEFVRAIQGFLDHEVAHLLFTDFSVVSAAQEKGKRVGTMHNIIEDTFIEREMRKKFPGSKYNLANVGEFFLDEFIDPLWEKVKDSGDEMEVAGALMVPAMRAWSGQTIFQDYMEDKWDKMPGIVEKLDDLKDKVGKVRNSRECLDLAEEIVRVMETPEEPETGSAEPDSSEKIGKVSKRGDSGSDEDGEKGKKFGRTDDYYKDDDETETEDSDEEGKEDEVEPSDGDDREGESDGSDDAEDEEETAESSEGHGDSEEDEDDSEADEGTSSGIDEDDEDLIDDYIAPEKEDSGLEDLSKCLDAISGDDFDGAVMKKISSHAEELSMDSDYLIYTKDFDVVEEYQPQNPIESGLLEAMEDKTGHMIGVMQKDIERMMAAASRTVKVPGKRSGRLHAASLYRLSVGDPRVFRKHEVHRSKDVAVSLVVDCSGSMNGPAIETAANAAFALSSTLERVGINHEVLGFTTINGYDGAGEAHMHIALAEQRRIGREFSRVEPLYVPIFKGFNERLTPTVKHRFADCPHKYFLANNVDGECVEIAGQRLAACREERKVMMVLSDGEPYAVGNKRDQSNHLKRVVRNLNDNGIETIGIGIMSSAVERYYDKYVVMEHLNELPTQIMRELRSILA